MVSPGPALGAVTEFRSRLDGEVAAREVVRDDLAALSNRMQTLEVAHTNQLQEARRLRLTVLVLGALAVAVTIVVAAIVLFR